MIEEKLKGGEKMKRISLILIVCLLVSFTSGILASAKEYSIDPRYNNSNAVNHTFEITNNTAIATVSVTGYKNITSRISVNVKLEKRALLGLIWNNVEEWNVFSFNPSETFEFRKSVGSGTYRCSFEITVEGSNGSADVITEQTTVKN